MDAYNRGYSSGLSDGVNIVGGEDIDGLGLDIVGLSVGTAKVLNIEIPDGSPGAGFYAQAYSIGSGANTKIFISYRGTDEGFIKELLFTDIPIFFFANASVTQLGLASQFYKLVYSESEGHAITLTGHSLGGALAGFTAALFLEPGVLVDNIGFVRALGNFLDDWEAYGKYTAYSDVQAAYVAYKQDSLEFFPGFELSIEVFTKKYNTLSSFGISPDRVFDREAIDELLNEGLKSFYLDGSVATDSRGPFPVPEPVATLRYELGNIGSIVGRTEAHSVSLNVIFQYLEMQLLKENGINSGANALNFKPIMKDFLSILHDDKVAEAAGIRVEFGEDYGAGQQLQSMIAYSALDGDVGLVFGNTAIRALFDDANELGALKNAGRFSQSMSQSIEGLSETFVQFAGMLAQNKVAASVSPNLNPLLGVVSLLKDGAYADVKTATTVMVNLTEATWSIGAAADAPNPSIVGVDKIVALLGRYEGVRLTADPDVESFKLLYGAGLSNAELGRASYVVERIEFSISNANLTMEMGEPNATGVGNGSGPRHVWMYVSGSGNDTLTGNSKANVLFGGKGQDNLNGGDGKDILFGGDDNDTLYGNTNKPKLNLDGTSTVPKDVDADFFLGGKGTDKYYVSNLDTIWDNEFDGSGDGLGKVYFDNTPITGSKNSLPPMGANATVTVGAITYKVSDDGLDLIVSIGNKSFTIKSWQNGELGIKFEIDPQDPGPGDGGDPYGSPLVLDLDGDGLEITNTGSGVYFDIDNDGLREFTNWVAPDDGLLAFDANGDGVINNASELFGYGSSLSMGRCWRCFIARVRP
jgi:RTX calcium-binding nonapeptide repeat (4 copies)/Protein of unknown function (DUF2974)